MYTNPVCLPMSSWEQNQYRISLRNVVEKRKNNRYKMCIIRPSGKTVLLIAVTVTVCMCIMYRMDYGSNLHTTLSKYIRLKNEGPVVLRNQFHSKTKPDINSWSNMYNYVITEKDTCKRNHTANVNLFIAVCVAANRFERRNTIRNTWGSLPRFDKQLRLIFLVGTVDNKIVQEKILNESKVFHDIVQGDFVDSYRNLSVKLVFLLNWVTIHCPNAKYIFKTDDDVFVNLSNLLNVLKVKHHKRTIFGFKVFISRPVRDMNSKWYIPLEQYNKSDYPPYISGPGYVISRDIVSELYEASQEIPLIEVEDVYITGLCRSKIVADAVYVQGFTNQRPPATGCALRHLIPGHSYNLQEMWKIWTELNDHTLTC